jgi:osomolarity two-component system sensor histidine kinase SLN1
MLKKSLALWGALWLIVNWVVGVALLDKDRGSTIKSDIAFYYVVRVMSVA